MELVGADEKSVTSYQYDAYGNTTITGKQTTANELAYTGGVYDKTTEEYYLNARYYDPADGRFLTQDTYRGEDTDTSTWNLYSYCGGNPVNYVDPSGHKKVDANTKFLLSLGLIGSIMNYKKSVSMKKIINNYAYNIKHDYQGGYISYQANSNVRSMKYGLKNIKKTGCGVVAAYNFMTFLKKKYRFKEKIRMSRVISIFEITGAATGSGTDSYKLKDALNLLGIGTKSLKSMKEVEKARKKKKSMIFGYKTILNTNHAIFIDTSRKSEIRAWNEWPGEKKYVKYKSIKKMLSYQKFICAYSLR